MRAIGTGYFHRFIVCDPFARRVGRTAIKESSLLVASLYYLTLATFRTGKARGLGFGKFALGIGRTGYELPKSATPESERTATLGTLLVYSLGHHDLDLAIFAPRK